METPCAHLLSKEAYKAIQGQGSGWTLILALSELEHSLPPALGQPCNDIPSFKWHCRLKEQTVGVCQTCLGGLPGVSSASAFPLELGPRPPRRGGVDRLSPWPRLRALRALSEGWEEQLDGCPSPCSPSSPSTPWRERGPLCP